MKEEEYLDLDFTDIKTRFLLTGGNFSKSLAAAYLSFSPSVIYLLLKRKDAVVDCRLISMLSSRLVKMGESVVLPAR